MAGRVLVNRYVMGLSTDADAETALGASVAFPRGCGGTTTCCSSSSGCGRNDAHAHPATKVRFYGLDLYSLQASIEAVIGYLDRFDPAEARRAWSDTAVSIMSAARPGPTGYALAFQGAIPCENEVVSQLVSLRHRAEAYLRRDGWVAEDELFFAEQSTVSFVTPRSTTSRCTEQRFRHEPAGPPHGGHARRARRASGPAVRAVKGRGVGAQLARR